MLALRYTLEHNRITDGAFKECPKASVSEANNLVEKKRDCSSSTKRKESWALDGTGLREFFQRIQVIEDRQEFNTWVNSEASVRIKKIRLRRRSSPPPPPTRSQPRQTLSNAIQIPQVTHEKGLSLAAKRERRKTGRFINIKNTIRKLNENVSTNRVWLQTDAGLESYQPS